ncbi:MAG: hypothetical protein M0P95_04225 [Sulfuritalea sp.]|jgi:methionyl-tRNA formyltransferase|nr:hypothetical protein [Sulfuritalea sp.]
MNDRFVFVGNRRFVLEQMLSDGVNLVAVIVVAGSHLERDIRCDGFSNLEHIYVVRRKSELITLLGAIQFDILVSNGCPYILPVTELPAARYVNIHPSLLPDLRGADPVIGAVLFERDAGATCHVMDSGIDTGPVIAQIRIPFTDDLDVTTLYQLSFIAEKKVFSESLQLGFEPQFKQAELPDILYYSRKPEDRLITFLEPNHVLLQKVMAFNNRKAGCEFVVSGVAYRVFSAKKMHNPFLLKFMDRYPDCVIGFSYEGSIVFRKDEEVLRFSGIESSSGNQLSVGASLL